MPEVGPAAVRAQHLADLVSRPLDLLVIGGGIVGAGVARDAAMRGLRTGLVEKHDFAFGASSRSSRLLHGGLRYLAQGRLGLVYEASQEKMVLHGIAPHLAEPLAFVFPTYRGTSWQRWKLSIGVKLYDLLCGRHNLGRSAALGPAAVREMLPGIRAEDLTGGVRYFDGFTNDARLVLDTLRSAARHEALVLNHAELRDAVKDGPIWRCSVRDLLGSAALEVKARSVVNATGPWAAGIPHSRLRLRLTKGVHLVIDARRLPLPGAVVMTDGERILFAIPWGERIILGTTDTDYSGAVEDAAVDASDVEYILNIVNRHFPDATLTAADVIRTWAGLRPLIASGRGGPSEISRTHQILMPEPGWFDVAGGKLTTYRRIAEQVVDRVAARFDRGARPCSTAIEPLLPAGPDAASSGILPPPVRADLVEHYCRQEWAMHLDDVMVRRTSWHNYHANAAAIAAQVAAWMAAVHGWDAARRADELAGCSRSLLPEGTDKLK
jgi:glycerol-3-phosphate dehydrogenase